MLWMRIFILALPGKLRPNSVSIAFLKDLKSTKLKILLNGSRSKKIKPLARYFINYFLEEEGLEILGKIRSTLTEFLDEHASKDASIKTSEMRLKSILESLSLVAPEVQYRDPYDIAASGFTQQEEAVCDIPRLYMYSNEEEMIESLKGHVDRFKQETQCKNYDIALISFEDTLLIPQNVEKLSSLLGKKMYVLKNRQTSSLSRSIKTDDPIILSDPYNVNGLEFKCVILFGVDEGRLPQNTGVSDISANYIKYIAFNQLYLASSRAKYRLILIGNSLHGVSSCLQYALESGKLETGDQV